MRRRILILTAVFCLATVAFCQAQNHPEIALTFDDLPATGEKPHDLTRVQIVTSILDTLRKEKIPPTYGFVIGAQSQDAAQTNDTVLKAWRDAGNPLGSHTWSHVDLEAVTAEEFEENILKAEPVLEQYAGSADWHWLRYPYLHEGETLEKREAVRSFLREHHYQIAEVSLDFEDYLYNAPYARCRNQHDAGSLTAIHDSYLAVADEYTNLFRSMSHTLYGRDIPYVLLLHVGAATAAMLPDLIAQLRARGFIFVTLQATMKDPAYAVDAAIGLPGGGTLQEQLFAARKLRIPPNAKPEAELEKMCQK